MREVVFDLLKIIKKNPQLIRSLKDKIEIKCDMCKLGLRSFFDCKIKLIPKEINGLLEEAHN